jgi:hypothetical protein
MEFLFCNSLCLILRHTHRTFATNLAFNSFNRVTETSKTKRTMRYADAMFKVLKMLFLKEN